MSVNSHHSPNTEQSGEHNFGTTQTNFLQQTYNPYWFYQPQIWGLPEQQFSYQQIYEAPSPINHQEYGNYCYQPTLSFNQQQVQHHEFRTHHNFQNFTDYPVVRSMSVPVVPDMSESTLSKQILGEPGCSTSNTYHLPYPSVQHNPPQDATGTDASFQALSELMSKVQPFYYQIRLGIF